jgi:hypothetical protein
MNVQKRKKDLRERCFVSPEIKCFGIRGEILKALREDPEWRAKLEKAKSVEEFREVINAFVKSKTYR